MQLSNKNNILVCVISGSGNSSTIRNTRDLSLSEPWVQIKIAPYDDLWYRGAKGDLQMASIMPIVRSFSDSRCNFLRNKMTTKVTERFDVESVEFRLLTSFLSNYFLNYSLI